MFSLIKITAAIESFVGNLRNNPTLTLPLKIREGIKVPSSVPFEGIREGKSTKLLPLEGVSEGNKKY